MTEGKAQSNLNGQKATKASAPTSKIAVSTFSWKFRHLLINFKDLGVIDLITDESDEDAVGETDEEVQTPLSKKNRVGAARTPSPNKSKATPRFGLSSKKSAA